MAHNVLIRNPSTRWLDTHGIPTWTATTAFTSGQFVLPTAANANGFVFECTGSGTTAGTEPTWPAVLGGTVNDGSALWPCFSTTAILASELQQLDENVASAINAAEGGTYAPTSPIVIDGAGLVVFPAVVITRGGSLEGTVSSGAIALLDSDFPTYSPTHVGRTRSFMQSCIGGRASDGQFLWRARFSDCGMQAVSAMYDLSDGAGMRPTRMWVPLRIHDQATLSQVTVAFRVGFPHPQLPSKMPTFRVIRVDSGGNVLPLPLP